MRTEQIRVDAEDVKAEEDLVPPAAAKQLNLPALWQRKGFLLVWVLGAVALAGAYLVFAKPKFQVSARLLVEEAGNPLDDPRAARRDPDFLPTQAEVIASPAVVHRTVAALGLAPNPLDEKPPAVDILENLTVAPIVGTNVLTISYRHADPEGAQRTVEALIASYREFLQATEQVQQQDAVELLALREQECRAEVSRLSAELLAARKSSPLLGLGRDAAEVQRSLLHDVGLMLAEAKNQRVQLENQMAAVAPQLAGEPDGEPVVPVLLPVAREGSLHGTMDQVRYRAALSLLTSLAQEGRLGVEDPAPLQKALLEAQVLEAKLSQHYGPEHPEVKAVKRQIHSIEERLRKAVSELPELLDRELESQRLYEEQLTARYEQQLTELKQFDAFLLQEEQLLEELRGARAARESVVAQLQARKLVAAQREGPVTVSVRVLEEPALTGEPLRAPATMVMPLAAFFGLVGGVISMSVLGWGGKPEQPHLE